MVVKMVGSGFIVLFHRTSKVSHACAWRGACESTIRDKQSARSTAVLGSFIFVFRIGFFR
jgi:hypothetical protein